MPDVPDEVVRLAEERADARSSGDFATADALRERIADSGWTVVDDPGGFRLVPTSGSATEPPARRRSAEVPSIPTKTP